MGVCAFVCDCACMRGETVLLVDVAPFWIVLVDVAPFTIVLVDVAPFRVVCAAMVDA